MSTERIEHTDECLRYTGDEPEGASFELVCECDQPPHPMTHDQGSASLDFETPDLRCPRCGREWHRDTEIDPPCSCLENLYDRWRAGDVGSHR